MIQTEYTRPYLYPKQEKALFDPKRWGLCEASTKSGKTVGSIAWILEEALGGQPNWNYWWVAPISSQARIAYNRIKNGLTPGTFTARETPEPTITLMNRTFLGFKSADNPDSLYGEDVYGAVMDEASRAKSDAWHALRSTLTATRGRARLIGNVKGKRNWFYEWCRRAERGLDPNASFMRITAQDAIDAGVLDPEEIEDAKRNLPERVFRELYMAEAVDESGNPFGEDHIYAGTFDKEAIALGVIKPGPVVAFGIDLAKRQDYLVLIGLDENGTVAIFERWHGLPWSESIRRIHEIVGEDIPALVDSTGVGDPVLEQLQIGHGNFRGYTFGSVSKQKLMEGLAVSIQRSELRWPDGPIKNELLGFEYKETPTGVRYAAAEGYYDDCVCSLALAREQWSTVAPATNLMAFYQGQAEAARVRLEKQLQDEEVTKRPILTRAEVVDNELTDLYRATLAQYQTEENLCFHCGHKVTENRVTDGVFVWHPSCHGMKNAA